MMADAMSDELRRRLRALEADYLSQPVVVQRTELAEINQLRAQLGLSPVNARLEELGAPAPAPAPVVASPAPRRDHSRARAIYEAYQKKAAVLELHQAYARRVAEATAGNGPTPVYPLAKMGRDGGPLRCDLCGKPIVLEGGAYDGLPADEAWAEHPNPSGRWNSWISGGMVVEITVNGTLRIFHGYPGRNHTHCCNAVRAKEEKARKEWEASKPVPPLAELRAFLDDTFVELSPDERVTLLTKIVDVMFSFDPGFGVNVPGEAKTT